MSPETAHSEAADQPQSSQRLMSAVRAFTTLSIGEMEVRGKDHLAEIPAGAHVVTAASHISDMDMMPVLQTLGTDFDFVITDQSVLRDVRRELPNVVAHFIAGRRHFIPISWHFDGEGKKHGQLNMKDFHPVREAMRHGKAVLMAAHNPSYGSLPKPGVGAMLIAETTPNVVILPVSVDVQYKHPEQRSDFRGRVLGLLERPKAVVSIGHPIVPIERTDPADLMIRPDHPAKAVRRVVTGMRDRSRVIMEQLASMLPEGKRGMYRRTEQQ